MRIENQGLLLWYGTQDAPAPDDHVVAGPEGSRTDLSLTVAVAPPDPSNSVEVRYRVNQGAPQVAVAAFLRADGARRAQYFRVWLPLVRLGDVVEYTPVCHCVGRQVPAPEQLAGYVSSFRVVSALRGGAPPSMPSAAAASTGPVSGTSYPGQPAERGSGADGASRGRAHDPGVRELEGLIQPGVLYAATARAADDPVVSQRLDELLREDARRVIGRASVELGSAVVAVLSRVRWQDVTGHRIGELADQALAEVACDPRLAGESAPARVRVAATTTPTVEEALHLSTPVLYNPALHDDVTHGLTLAYAHLAGLSDRATQAVVQHSQTLVDTGPPRLAAIAAQGLLGHDEAAQLEAVLELAKLTHDNLTLVRALHSTHATWPQSLLGWSRQQWETFIVDQKIPTPPGDTGATYADAIVHNLETTYPTHALAVHAGDPHVSALLAGNPNLDLRTTNLVGSKAGELDWSQIPVEARATVEDDLRAHQRLLPLADGTQERVALKNAGYDSAMAIAGKSEPEFVRTSGLTEGPARLTYARAQDRALSVALHYASLHDLVRGGFKELPVANVTPLVNALREIDGLGELFGPQDFCDCEHCKSVLSPAAYFVDLMHFVETHVSQPIFIAPNRTQHSLYLKRRRPDLWTLQLTCENTNTLVPYLTIVTQVLEAYLGDAVGGDIYKTLSDPTVKVSFHVPLNLPFVELGLYLSHFGLAIADVYRVLDLPDAAVWQARLGLVADQAAVITTPDPANVAARLGTSGSLSEYDLQAFLRSTGLQRSELDSLLAMRFYPDLAAVTVTSKPDPDEPQNFPQVLANLTPARLDFMHRTIRLSHAARWQVSELDLLLLTAQEAGLIGHEIDDGVLELVGRLRELQTGLGVTVEELCALVGQLPVSTAFPRWAAPPERLLYERLFDLPTLFGPVNASSTGIGAELAQSFSFHHFAFNASDRTDTTSDPKTPLLLGPLAISETELEQLLLLLKNEVTFDHSGDCTMDRRRLSLLYRHTRIASALKLSVGDFIASLELLFEPSAQVVTNLDQLQRLIAFTAWVRRSPFSIADLSFILAGIESSSVKYSTTSQSVGQLVQQVRATKGGEPLDTLRSHLATTLNLPAARLVNLLAWVASDLSGSAIRTALAATFTNGMPDKPGDLTGLVELVHQLERTVTLASKLKLNDDSIACLTRQPAAVGIASLKSLTLRDLQSIALYASLLALGAGAPKLVQAVLDSYLEAAPRHFSAPDAKRLAELWRVDQSLITSLCNNLTFPASPIDALRHLREGLAICTTLGVNASSLAKLGDLSSFAAVGQARDIARGALVAKYPDKALQTSTLRPYEDQINAIRRDALCDYVIARGAELNLRDRNEIYDFFLLDVEMSGCFETSRVVAAISSLQLYVQRCLLNLEQSPATGSAPEVQVSPAVIPSAEWDWRKNYRVWEANRKVFLYPESYLDPDLLDTKTPLLSELEDDLLQQKITHDSATDAYHKYISQFADLAHLRIAGSYYRAEKQSYYFFGRTRHDPPVYYWRTWDGTTWSPWTNIDLAIEAPTVAAEYHLGQLYIFWVDTKSKDHTTIADGKSTTDYYEVTVSLHYSALTAAGKWLPPQKLDSLHPIPSPRTISVPEAGIGTLTFTSPNNRVYSEAALKEMDLAKTVRRVYPRVVQDTLVLGYYNDHLPGPAYFDRQLDLFHNKLRSSNQPIAVPGARLPMLSLSASGQSGQLGICYPTSHTEPEADMALEPGLATGHPGVVVGPPPPGFGRPPSPQGGTVHGAIPVTTGHSGAVHGAIPVMTGHPGTVHGANPGTTGHPATGPVVAASPTSSGGASTYVSAPFPYNAEAADQSERDYILNLVHGRYPESIFSFGGQEYLIHETTPPAIPLSHPPPGVYTPGRVAPPPGVLHPQAVPPGHLPPSVHTPVTIASPLGVSHPQSMVPGHLPPVHGPVAAFGQPGVQPSPAPQLPISQLHGGFPAAPGNAIVAVPPAGFVGLRPTPVATSHRHLIRLSTSLADDLAEILMEHGLEALFDIKTQKLHEKPVGLTITDQTELDYPADDLEHLSFSGAFGSYYRELYLHIPWLIARNLRANGRFEEALWWYRRIFDPTASESPDDKRPTDRNWRYIEFRNLTLPKLRDMLTNGAAIDAYKRQPFNPHAIARLRPGAYQKAIVMDTINTVLDWGDALFSKDTMESVTEAGMLYVLASEMLGRRPARLGKCATVSDDQLTYEKLGPAIARGSEFLLTLENWTHVSQATVAQAKVETAVKASAFHSGANGSVRAPVSPLFAPHAASTAAATEPPALQARAAGTPPTPRPALRRYTDVAAQRRQLASLVGELGAASGTSATQRSPAIQQAVHSTIAFCVPPNEVLLSAFDRVEDRLTKLRNCMNISGVRRQLALFQPPIDPMALVRAQAAGLSLDEAMAALEAPVPPYRFAHLIDRARQAAQTVQSFGAALLSALEKKDVEELTLLRSLHERVVLRMTKDVKTKQVQEAQQQLQALVETSTNVQNRIDYYTGLISGGLTGWETTEQVSRHAATVLKGGEVALHLLAGILHLVPQLGSPFAMKYGGQELGDSAGKLGDWTGSLAGILEGVAASAGLEATFQRREQEWRQQLLLAQQELKQVEQQRLAGETRAAIAEKELEIHKATIDHAAELDEFYKGKFTNLGLYNYLATNLTRLHHEAYGVADQLARMAQRAYQFERDDDTMFIAPDNWQADKNGLLAGERLTLQLQHLENAYLSTNTRQLEVTQSFPLALLDPQALLTLRETGTCAFTLPEIVFDLAYPGQYKRIVKAVRITIPSVVGPYTSVSAKLSLTGSKVRKLPKTDADALVPLPVQTTPSVAVSSAVNDAGMFDFSFRDERYLPFEGAGAVSTWELTLPSQLRMFDYRTIPDVILHMSYTAADDGALRTAVETALVDDLTAYASTVGMHRLFSLRHDFPDAFYKLLQGTGPAQETQFDITQQHFPYFLSTRTLVSAGASLYVEPKLAGTVDTTGLAISVNGAPSGAWTTLAHTSLIAAEVAVAGPAVSPWRLKVTTGRLDPESVRDLLVLLMYKVT